MRYVIRDRRGGNVIDKYDDKNKAIYTLDLFEAQDLIDGIYEPHFYEVYDTINKETIYEGRCPNANI